jgi:hypothetical protein
MYEIITTLWFFGQWLLFSTAACIVSWRGGRYERYGFAILVLCYVIAMAPYAADVHISVLQFAPYYALADLIGFVLLVILAYWSRRLWPLFAAAFQLNAVATHFSMLIIPQMDSFSYVTGIELWGWYAINLAVIFGVWEHQKRLKLGIA